MKKPLKTKSWTWGIPILSSDDEVENLKERKPKYIERYKEMKGHIVTRLLSLFWDQKYYI